MSAARGPRTRERDKPSHAPSGTPTSVLSSTAVADTRSVKATMGHNSEDQLTDQRSKSQVIPHASTSSYWLHPGLAICPADGARIDTDATRIRAVLIAVHPCSIRVIR